MTLKEYLEKLDVFVEDDGSIIEFFNREDIVTFLKEAWESTDKSIDNTVFLEEEIMSDSEDTEDELLDITENTGTNNTELTMSIFNDNTTDYNREASANEAFQHQINSAQIVLQNAKVGVEYSFFIDLSFFANLDIADFWVEGLNESGLVFNKKTSFISGIPIKAGDYKLTLKFKRDDWEEGKPIFQRTLTLIINPDPRSLWNNIPTSSDIAYYKDDSDKEFVKVAAKTSMLGFIKSERKDLVAASQRGRSHAHEGTPRDDDFSMSFDEETQWYTLIVADGAGSAKYSRRGSQLACETVADVCKKQLINLDKILYELIKEYNKDKDEVSRKKVGDKIYEILGAAAFKAYKRIEEESVNSNSQLKDFSTTLIAAICKKFKFGWFVASFWVGDGGIGIYNKDTQFLKVMGESDGGEFAGQTRFLTMPEIMKPEEIYRRLRFDIVDDFTSLILMTDGVTDPKFETDANLLRIEKWNDLWEDINREVTLTEDNDDIADQLLGWLDFWSPGNHDDRTIAILF